VTQPFRLRVKGSDGFSQDVTLQTPVPTSVVGQHAQLDDVQVTVTRKIDDATRTIVEALGKIVVAIDEPTELHFEFPADMAENVADTIGDSTKSVASAIEGLVVMLERKMESYELIVVEFKWLGILCVGMAVTQVVSMLLIALILCGRL